MQKQVKQRTFPECHIGEAVNRSALMGTFEEFVEATELHRGLLFAAYEAIDRVLASEELRQLTAGPDQAVEMAFWMTPAGKIESGE